MPRRGQEVTQCIWVPKAGTSYTQLVLVTYYFNLEAPPETPNTSVQ